MSFNHVEYPGERFICEGKDVSVDIRRPTQRSDLAKLVHDYPFLLKEGLLGGTTSVAWCLLAMEERQPKLEYRGLKKIEGRQVHELKYQAKKRAADFKIFLYFESDTFRHVLSEYELRVQPWVVSNLDDSAK
jgi:hypothetical protein